MTSTKKELLTEVSDTYTLSTEGVNYSDLIPTLKKYLKDIPFKGKSTFMNTPMVVNQNQLDAYSRICKLLNTVLRKIVANYFNDERIRNIYQLDTELESILRLAESTPYKVGLYRPDIVIDKNGQSKICEIGCRYPLNGWMLSYYMNCTFNELTPPITSDWEVVPKQTDFISILSKDLDVTKPLYYVHDLEVGTEAFQFFNELKKDGFSVADISPNKLNLTNGKLTVNGELATQFILEMDREELKKIKPEIIKAVIESEKCFNDVRTLILVHDKRILSVLYNEQIMADYIHKEDYDFLKRFLIPSFTLDSEKRRNELIDSTENWVLKKSSGGRGIGIYVKNDCSTDIWKAVITKEWKHYMVQEYVDQKLFDLEQDGKVESINSVGMLLCYNDRSFGPGIFRGSSKSVINVHSGGYILPSVISKL